MIKKIKKLEINLSGFAERFSPTSQTLSITKQINFIYGKNGTGKTTIADEIKNLFGNEYDVCMFKDFDNIVGDNKRLSAIALGSNNSEIQRKIEQIDKEIEEIKKETEEQLDKTDNLFMKEKKARENCEKQKKKIDNIFRDVAHDINLQNDPRLVPEGKTTYNKNDLEKEIKQAKLLPEDEINRLKQTISSTKKEPVKNKDFPELNGVTFLQSTNEILKSSVLPQENIPELNDKTEKQNFAKEGQRIHTRVTGEKCAFCGNEISEARWILLGNYFNDSVKTFEKAIEEESKKFDCKINSINNVTIIDKTDFLNNFASFIEGINTKITTIKATYENFLKDLKSALDRKSTKLFAKSEPLEQEPPSNFDEIKKSYDQIVKENNDFLIDLEKKQKEATDALRYHEIKKNLDRREYENNRRDLEISEVLKAKEQKALNDKKEKINQKEKERDELISKTTDEKKIANKINELLKNMGLSSFSLELVNDEENQKGQYKIKGHNNKIRLIEQLSKGEKNIVAFLYFLLSLTKENSSKKHKIVVIDDPMTSNDDTMQYLMITEIKKYSKTLKSNDYLIVLTHNCHFYLNVSGNSNKKSYKKYGYFVLFSDGKTTIIKPITKEEEDFKTNYDLLWKELMFLYDQNKPDLMLNCCRRICETYMNFNCKVNFYDNTNNPARKLFNVNSHSVDDLEAEQNGRSKDEIKKILEELFKNNNAKEHFDAHWKQESKGIKIKD